MPCLLIVNHNRFEHAKHSLCITAIRYKDQKPTEQRSQGRIVVMVLIGVPCSNAIEFTDSIDAVAILHFAEITANQERLPVSTEVLHVNIFQLSVI